MQQEVTVFGAIAEARTHYANAKQGSAEQATAATQYEGALARLMVVMENYPILQSNTTVQHLMAELSGTENRVAVGRDRYNQSVQTYNITLKSFPKNMIAGMFGFEPRAQFSAVEGASKAPAVNLDL
jgi:LemA protein